LYLSWTSASAIVALQGGADPNALRFAVPGGARTTLASAIDRGTADSGKLYFVENGAYPGEIRSVPHSGGVSTAFASGLPTTGSALAMANDASTVCVVHFANFTTPQTVYCAPKTGGAATKVAITGLPVISDIGTTDLVLTPTHILIAFNRFANCFGGGYLSVWSVPRGGGSATMIQSATGVSSQTHDLVADGVHAYWLELRCTSSGVWTARARRAPLGGGTIVDIAAYSQGEAPIDIDESYLYFTDRKRLFRVAK
jgi:hypothetical protein